MAYSDPEKKKAAMQRTYAKMKRDPETWKRTMQKNHLRCQKWRKKRTFAKLVSWLKSRLKSHGVTSTITTANLLGLAKRQRLICPLTGRRLTADNISLDHIIPLSRGGSNNISNLRLVDIDANFSKQKLSDTAFLALCSDVVNYLKISP